MFNTPWGCVHYTTRCCLQKSENVNGIANDMLFLGYDEDGNDPEITLTEFLNVT